jgi:hypothetical protein
LRSRSLVGLAFVVIGGALALTARDRASRSKHGSTLLPAAQAASYSNILPGDYVGPQACKECHEEKYKDWSANPHGKMNRDASSETVRGDFSGVRVSYQGGTALFSTAKDLGRAPRHEMTLERDGKVVRRYEITRVVGSRFMQHYIGVEVEGPDAASSVTRTKEQKLPFGYWFKLKRWVPTSYFDPVGAETNRDGTPVYDPYDHPRVHVWSQNCMLCHNTYPFAFRMALPNGLAGFPPAELMVASAPLSAEIAKSIDLRQDGTAAGVRERIQPTNLVTLGVSCESCHFGGREHAKNDREIQFLPTSPWLKLSAAALAKKAAPDKENAYAVNHICAQCHCATITRFPNGAGTWNSREALDQMEGACASQMKCTDCHDPHKTIGPEAQRTNDEVALASCARCHPKLATPEAAKAHSRHANVSCLDCHMPRVTQGLEEVVRTHRIASPAEASMVAAGSANACNMCHLEKPITWTLAELEKGWKVKRPLPDAKAYGGDLEAPVGRTWLASSEQPLRLLAGQAYARSPLGAAALPEIVRGLDDPVAVNRIFAGFAIERIRGRPVSFEEFDPMGTPDARRRQVDAILGAAVK